MRDCVWLYYGLRSSTVLLLQLRMYGMNFRGKSEMAGCTEQVGLFSASFRRMERQPGIGVRRRQQHKRPLRGLLSEAVSGSSEK